MPEADASLDVNAPIGTVYAQWTRLEELPRFMGSIEEVRKIGRDTYEFVGEIGGRTRQWKAKITRQEPNEVVEWKSITGADTSGTVRFQEIGPDMTRVSVHMTFDPDDVIEAAGSALGVLEKSVKADLERFKDHVEGTAHAPPGRVEGRGN